MSLLTWMAGGIRPGSIGPAGGANICLKLMLVSIVNDYGEKKDKLILCDWISSASNSWLRGRGYWHSSLSFRFRHGLRIADLGRHPRSLLVLRYLLRAR